MHRHPDRPTAPRNPSRGVALARGFSLAGLAAAFILVFCGTWSGFPPDAHLSGAERQVKVPRLTARSWFDGTFVAAVEPWLARNLGWRGIGIRTANLINTTIFRRPPGGANSTVLVGTDGWLFEKAYVRERTRRPAFKPGEAEAFAEELERLQQLCHRRNMAFAVLIAPSKAEIYPEYLPAQYRNLPPEVAAQSNACQQLVAALQETEGAYVDARADFLAWKREGVDLFPPGGTHWNHYGAQRALDHVWQVLRGQPVSPALPRLPVTTGHCMRSPLGSDNDLVHLLNLWTAPKGGRRQVPFPLLEETPATNAVLRIAMAGDSFAFTLIDALARTGIRGEVDFFFYCRHHYHERLTGVRREHAEPEDLGSIGFDAVVAHPRLAEADVLLLVFNEIHTRQRGWGLPAALLETNKGVASKPARGMGVPPMKHGQDARATYAGKGFCKGFNEEEKL